MTEALYLHNSYMREFHATVTAIRNERFIVLDKTAFYPTSGGQPHDMGKIIRESDGKEFNVQYVGKVMDSIDHDLNEPGLKVGDKVKGIIDWQRRHKLMRSHTAAHIVSGVFSKKYNAKITGNQLDVDKIRIDFDLENFDRNIMDEVIKESNELIAKDLKIKTYEMPRAEVEKNPEMVKLAAGLPPGIDVLRIIEIVDFDRQPDGGTHVHSLHEVGPLEVIKMENKGKNNRRVYFKLVN
jgi:misacylated tRNA(Ala) deacylase